MDPNLRNGVEWWKGNIVADKAASEDTTSAGLYCFYLSLDGIMAQDILLSEFPWYADDRQALLSNPMEPSLSGFPFPHKQ